MAFPKIIHQTWKNEQVPAFLAACQESWKQFNPDWEYRLWTDTARVLYLWRFGGLYVDLDIEALRPADELLDGHSCTAFTIGPTLGSP